MSDAELRALERRWTADPGDAAATFALLAALRRARRPASARLLEARVSPPRRINARGRYGVWAVRPDGSTVLVGATPSPTDLELPAHRLWSLEPTRPLAERTLDQLLGEAQELACPALRLELGGPIKRAGERLARLAALERLDLTGHGHLRDEDVQALTSLAGLHHLALRGCFNLGGDAVLALERLEQLVSLDLGRSFSLGDGALPRLEPLPVLEELVLDRTAVRAEGVARLRSSSLRRLSLRGCSLRGRAGCPFPGALDLGGLPALASLDLVLSDIQCADLRNAPADLRVDSADARLVVDWGPDGWCPVQAGGTVAGEAFYFRARGEHWSFTVGDDRAPLFVVEEGWGDGPYAAGWMPFDEAERLVLRCAHELLARVDRGEIRLPGATSAA